MYLLKMYMKYGCYTVDLCGISSTLTLFLVQAQHRKGDVFVLSHCINEEMVQRVVVGFGFNYFNDRDSVVLRRIFSATIENRARVSDKGMWWRIKSKSLEVIGG